MMTADMQADTPARFNSQVSRPRAWFAFAMIFLLMISDYVDRQITVSLFPHLKLEWDLSDKRLGALVSVISIVVALGSIPVALLADRFGRVKSIFVMATIWSLATISCMFAQLWAAVCRPCRGGSGRNGLWLGRSGPHQRAVP